MKHQKTLNDILKEAIDRYGADGIVNVELECACTKDDLMPCGDPHLFDCALGRRASVPEGYGEDVDYWLVPLEVPGKDGAA